MATTKHTAHTVSCEWGTLYCSILVCTTCTLYAGCDDMYYTCCVLQHILRDIAASGIDTSGGPHKAQVHVRIG